jgi:soluble lytic murein transglycosylase-like protein
MQAAAQRYGVPVSLVLAVTAVESAFNPRAYNPNDPGGAWGLMQMIPATARGLGYTGPMDALLTNPSQAIDLGTRLLGDNLKRSGGSVADSVSAYNGGFRPSLGFGAVRANGTYGNQAYVDRVLSEQKYFRGWLGESGGSLGPVLLVLAILAVAYFTFSKGASIP